MTEDNDNLKKAADEAVKKERARLAKFLFDKSLHMSADYRNTIRHTGGLVTSSMVYAYSKGLNDAIKLLLKENNDEKSV